MTRPTRVGLLSLLGLYLVARVVVLAGGHVFLSNDTPSYALRADPALNHGSLVSLTGHAPRQWGVPVFYALFPGDGARAVAQWTLGTLAWGLLAWAVTHVFRTVIAKLVAVAAVLGLALHDAVGNWDFAMLSESLSISLGVVTLALLIRWLAVPDAHAGWLAGAGAAAFWWTFTRPDIRVFTVFVIAALAGVAWRWRPGSANANASAAGVGGRGRWRAAVAGAAVLVVAVGWCSLIQPNVAAAGPPYSFFGVEQAQDEWMLFRLRAQVLPDPEIRSIFIDELGMPVCPAADEIAQRVPWDMADFARAYRECADLQAWGRAQGQAVFARFARVAPGAYARMTVELVNQSWQGASYADVPWVIPPPLQKLTFPGRFGLLWVLVGVALAVGATLAARSRRHLGVAVAAWLVAAAVVSTGGGILAGTGEFWRFGIQEAIGLRLAVILGLVAALDTALARTDGRLGGLRSWVSSVVSRRGVRV